LGKYAFRFVLFYDVLLCSFPSYWQHLELEAAIFSGIFNIFELKPLIFRDICVTFAMPCARTFAILYAAPN